MVSQRISLALILAIFLSGCAALPAPGTETTPFSTDIVQPSATPDPTLAPPHRPAELVLWLTPSFSPSAETEAGTLLAARLEEFEQSYPGLTISVRLKDKSGTAGMIESLVAASLSAASALPDLIVVDRAGIELLAHQGLLIPIGGQMPEPFPESWYDFSLESARVDGTLFGLPLASESQVLAYRADLHQKPPLTWPDLLDSPPTFVFPAADPSASFTLAQYLALGGTLADEDGNPALEASTLAEVLAFYLKLQSSGILSSTASQRDTAEVSWNLLRSGNVTSAVAPLSSYFSQRNPLTTSAVPLPSRSSAVAFTETYSWAIVSTTPEREQLSFQLLLWLSESSFMGSWTFALGLLPPNQDALEAWPVEQDAALASQIVTVAQAWPSEDVLASYGPALLAAISAVLDGSANPEDAALAAVAAIQNP